MSEENNNAAAAAPKAPRVTKTIEVRVEEARAAVAKAQATLAALESELNNRTRFENLAAGQVVSFEFGRAEKRRTLSGTILSVHEDPKGGKLLVVQSGEGLDIQINKVPASSIIFDGEAAAEEPAAVAEAAAESPSDVLAGVA